MSFQYMSLPGVEPQRNHTHFSVPTSIERESENDRLLYSSPSKEKASKYKGVYKCGRKWKTQVKKTAIEQEPLSSFFFSHGVCQVQIGGVQYYLGVYEKEEDAFNMYLEFIKKNPQLHWNHLSTSPVEQSSESSLYSHAALPAAPLVDVNGFKLIEEEMYESVAMASSTNQFGTGYSDTASHHRDFYVPSPAIPSVHSNSDGGAVKKLRASEIHTSPLFKPHSAGSSHRMVCNEPDQRWSWRRQILIGKCLFLSSSLHQLQFQVYLSQHASHDRQCSSEVAPPLHFNDAHGRTNGHVNEHQEHPDSVARLTFSDFNFLFCILDQCLASLLAECPPFQR